MPFEAHPRSPIAYDPEAQGLIVRAAQQKGRLEYHNFVVQELRIATDKGLEWFIVNNLRFWSHHCNREALLNIEGGTVLMTIQDSILTPIAEESDMFAIAALLSRTHLLYKSPGFDIKRYLKRSRRRRAFETYFKGPLDFLKDF